MKKILTIKCGEEAPKQKVNPTGGAVDKNVTPLVENEVQKNIKEKPDVEMVQIPAHLLKLLTEGASVAQKANPGMDMAEFAKVLGRELSKSANANKGGSLRITPASIEDIDPEDILSPPSYFFCYYFKYSIYDDIRNGRAISPPLGAVKFSPITREVRQSGRGSTPSYHNMSVALVYSKQQRDFLINHSKFNITFFENQGKASNVNQKEAEYLVQAYNQIQSLNPHQLRSRLMQEGISITTMDESELRRKLCEKISIRLASENERIVKEVTQRAFEKDVPIVT